MVAALKLTPKTQAVIIKLLTEGNYIETACRAAGICNSTFASWMKRGEGEGYDAAKFIDFREKALQASAIAEAALLRKAIQEGNREAIPIMERRWPDRWRRQDSQSVEVMGKDGGPVQIENVRAVILGRLSRISAVETEGENISKSIGAGTQRPALGLAVLGKGKPAGTGRPLAHLVTDGGPGHGKDKGGR
jgi:hypothetical protein